MGTEGREKGTIDYEEADETVEQGVGPRLGGVHAAARLRIVPARQSGLSTGSLFLLRGEGFIVGHEPWSTRIGRCATMTCRSSKSGRGGI